MCRGSNPKLYFELSLLHCTNIILIVCTNEEQCIWDFFIIKVLLCTTLIQIKKQIVNTCGNVFEMFPTIFDRNWIRNLISVQSVQKAIRPLMLSEHCHASKCAVFILSLLTFTRKHNTRLHACTGNVFMINLHLQQTSNMIR